MDNNKIKQNNKFLRLAVISGNNQAVKHFIESGADINIIDQHCKTPLIHAVNRKHIDICKLLLQAGADPYYEDKDGKSPISIARDLESNELILLLKEKNVEIDKDHDNEFTFDFDDNENDEWEVEESVSIPESNFEVIEGLREESQKISEHITIDSDETLEDLVIDFPDIFNRKKKIIDPLYTGIRDIFYFCAENEVFHRHEYYNRLPNLKTLKKDDLYGSLEATLSAAGVNILFSEVLLPFYCNLFVCDQYFDFEADEMIDYMELELDSYRDPLAIFLNEAQHYPLLTESQVKTSCHDLENAYYDLIQIISSNSNLSNQIIDEIGRYLPNDDTIGEESSDLDDSKDTELKFDDFYNISRLSKKDLIEKYSLQNKQTLNTSDSLFTYLVDLLLDWEFLVNICGSSESLDKNICDAIHNIIQKYRVSKERIVKGNLRLVYSIAKKYQKSGIPVLDLIQEGTIGLMKAIDRFDYKLGNKFSTYATWWIRQSITRYISNEKDLIRIPVHMQEAISKYRQVKEYLFEYPFSDVVDSDIADFLQWSLTRVQTVKNAKKTIIPIDLFNELENQESWKQCLTDDTDAHDPVYMCFLNDLRSLEFKFMEVLRDREKEVLLQRTGFYFGEIKTLEQLGEQFGITRERIRQIEAKGLRRLRNPKYFNQLKDYYPGSASMIRNIEFKLKEHYENECKKKKSKSNKLQNVEEVK